MIGTHLARALRERGDDVLIVSRASSRLGEVVPWDPARGVLSPRLLAGTDVVYNLAAAPIADRPWTRARRKVLYESRVAATEALLESLVELDPPPKAFIGVSNIGIYGDRGEVVLDDDDPPGAGFLAELCIAWEHAHLSAEEALGCRVAVLRLAPCLSPTGGPFPLMVRPFRLMGGWLGDGRQYAPWISVRDAVGALIHLATDPKCQGVFNGTVPDPTSNKEWLKGLGRALHRPVLTHAPKWALRGALGELADELYLASVRAVPRKLIESGYTFVDTDAEATFRWLVDELATLEGSP